MSAVHPRRFALRGEGGFTLIELMVVVMVIAILMAIAVPTFMGARSRSNDKAAQSNARNAVTAAVTYVVDSGDFAPLTAADLTAAEPNLGWQTAVSTSARQVSWNVDTTTGATAWGGAVWSKSGKCFRVKVTGAGAATYGSGTVAAECTGAFALTATGMTSQPW